MDLIGVSGGAMAAIMVAEALPDGALLNRAVLIGPDVSRDYDLSRMLDHAARGAVCYFSPFDGFDFWAALTFETFDTVRAEPAATFGFDSDDPRLVQFHWTPNMLAYGSIGQHLDYALLPEWVRDFIAPFVVP